MVEILYKEMKNNYFSCILCYVKLMWVVREMVGALRNRKEGKHMEFELKRLFLSVCKTGDPSGRDYQQLGVTCFKREMWGWIMG